MSKKSKELKEKSFNNEVGINKYFGKNILIKSCITTVLIIVLLSLSISFKEKITKLTIISVDSFLTCGYIFLSFSIISLIISLFILFIKNISTIFGYYAYTIHDLINFIIAVIYIIFFILSFLLTPTTVSGSSMNNTLYDSDMLLVWHLNYKPKRDDVVIIDISNTTYPVKVEEQFYIKRIVALEGDKLTYQNDSTSIYGQFYVNDTLVEEKMRYSEFSTLCSIYTGSNFTPFTSNTYEAYVPVGYSVVLGDNRNNSNDSRYIGAIKNSDILGKALFRYFSKSGSIGKIGKNII